MQGCDQIPLVGPTEDGEWTDARQSRVSVCQDVLRGAPAALTVLSATDALQYL